MVHSLIILVPVHTGMAVSMVPVLSTVNIHLFDRICLCHLIGNFFCPSSAFLVVVLVSLNEIAPADQQFINTYLDTHTAYIT